MSLLLKCPGAVLRHEGCAHLSRLVEVCFVLRQRREQQSTADGWLQITLLRSLCVSVMSRCSMSMSSSGSSDGRFQALLPAQSRRPT